MIAMLTETRFDHKNNHNHDGDRLAGLGGNNEEKSNHSLSGLNPLSRGNFNDMMLHVTWDYDMPCLTLVDHWECRNPTVRYMPSSCGYNLQLRVATGCSTSS